MTTTEQTPSKIVARREPMTAALECASQCARVIAEQTGTPMDWASPPGREPLARPAPTVSKPV